MTTKISRAMMFMQNISVFCFLVFVLLLVLLMFRQNTQHADTITTCRLWDLLQVAPINEECLINLRVLYSGQKILCDPMFGCYVHNLVYMSSCDSHFKDLFAMKNLISCFYHSIWKMQSLTVPICLEQFDRICARLCPEYIYMFSFVSNLFHFYPIFFRLDIRDK